jgi:hypothetical protein
MFYINEASVISISRAFPASCSRLCRQCARLTTLYQDKLSELLVAVRYITH